jgi:hypothetical protein
MARAKRGILRWLLWKLCGLPIHAPAAAARLCVVEAETRVCSVEAESRLCTVRAEG